MKYQTLQIIASGLGKLAWVVGAAGVAVSILIGIAAATTMARIGILLGGLATTAVFTLMLLASSRLIYLMLDVQKSLDEIAISLKKQAENK